MTAHYAVAGIGNAIVDVIARCDDAFIADNTLNKGAMTLIDADQATALYDKMPPGIEMSGGSAANTIAGLSSLGLTAAYIGKVADDQLGQVFRHDIRALGAHFDTAPVAKEPPTARCLILVTPDAQRTMNTYLGACVELTPDDVDEAVITSAQVTYMEGYLWDRPEAKEAYLKAAAVAHDAGRRVSLTLSDTFCVERHRDSFRELVSGHVDILFANEDEVMALYEVDSFEEAMEAVRADCEVAALTRSEKGAVIVDALQTYEVPAKTFGDVVDTTGAGDLFAAGFLAGFTHGRHPAECGKLGVIAAGEVIGHMGARPEANLKALADEHL
jgi:sugar/nucleoside kinase (ribokinase family)